MTKFKVGDKVRCVKVPNTSGRWNKMVNVGDIVTVYSTNYRFFHTCKEQKEELCGYYSKNFELAEEKKTFIVYDSYNNIFSEHFSTIEKVEEFMLSWAEDNYRVFKSTELSLTVYETKELPFKISKKIKWKQD